MPPSALDRLGKLGVLEYFFPLEKCDAFSCYLLMSYHYILKSLWLLCSIFAY
jgi:hypothetical protein